MVTDHDSDVDGLYELSPDEFIAARDGLAARLRSDGDREASRRVGQLRRPTVAAWAVNQVVRGSGDKVAALLETGQELRRAQRQLLSGVAAPGLRPAANRRRELVQVLQTRADEALERSGRDPGGHRRDVQTTFEAASIDEDAAHALQQARLSKPLAPPSGFGDLSALAVVRERPAAAPDEALSDADGQAELEAATKALEDAERKAARARTAADRARQETEERKSDARAASDEAASLERRAAAARRRADNAAADVERAEESAQRAQRSYERAAGNLEEASQGVARLREGA